MVDAVISALPRRLFASRDPLPRNPPARNLLRRGRICQVEDLQNMADVSLLGSGDVREPAVEVEAMHALAWRGPFADEFRLARRRHIVDPKAAAKGAGRQL